MRTTALYLRISSDPRDKRLGLDRQRRESLALVDRLELAGPVVEYPDNDRSAAAGKRREQFTRLVADLDAGRIATVVSWDQDRLTRDLEEWARLRASLRRTGTALATVTAGGLVDVETSSGGISTGLRAVLATAEVENKAERQRAWAADRAMRGQPQGRPAYGYQRVVETNALGYRVSSHDEPDDDQVKVLESVLDALLAGDTLYGIAAKLNAEGVPGPSGGPWTTRTLRRVVTNPTIAGRRRRNGEVVGPTAAKAVVDVDKFDRVSALLNAPGRRTGGGPSNTAAHLLSGIARCGRPGCDLPVRARGVAYGCPLGHTARRRVWVDKLVTATVIARLSQPDARDLLIPPSPDLTALEAEVAALGARLDLIADEYAAGTLDARSWQRARSRLAPALDAAQDRLRAARAAAGAPDVLAELLDSTDVERTWNAMTLARQRAVVAVLLEIRLLPVGKAEGQRMRWHGFDPATVDVQWRTP